MTKQQRAFWDFVVKRQDAYWRKQRGEGPPYSDDDALARFHFCNCWREADRGTIYYQNHRPSSKAPVHDHVFATLAYRLLNRQSAFEAYGGLPTRPTAEAFLAWALHRASTGEKIFTGRHLNVGRDGLQRGVRAAAGVEGGSAAVSIIAAASMEGVVNALIELPEIGRFFGWQLACDLLESDVLNGDVVRSAEDWAYLGPGAIRGARLVDPEGAPLDTARALRDCQPTDGSLVPPPQAPGPMSLKNVEHSLCEWARYVRATDETIKAKGLEVKPWAR